MKISVTHTTSSEFLLSLVDKPRTMSKPEFVS